MLTLQPIHLPQFFCIQMSGINNNAKHGRSPTANREVSDSKRVSPTPVVVPLLDVGAPQVPVEKSNATAATATELQPEVPHLPVP